MAAYVEALDVHECETAEALLLDRDDSWCDEVAGLGDAEASDHPAHSGRSPEDGSVCDQGPG